MLPDFLAAAPASVSAPVSAEELSGFTGVVVDFMEAFGVLGVALMVAAENLFPPIPSEVILPLAGFTASQGSMSLWGAILGATVGSVVGASALYWLGHVFGLQRLRSWGARIPLVDVEDIDRTVAWFHRYGTWGVLVGRLVPIFRSLISIPAGVDRMHLGFFLALTTIGSLVWNTALVMAGYVLGENWHIVEQYVGVFQKVVIIAVVVAVVWFVVSRIRRNRRRAHEQN